MAVVGLERERAGLGTGIYSIPEAARLLQVAPQKLARWAEGYSWGKGRRNASSAVIYREDAEPGLLTFCDLIELRFVREFRQAGVSLPMIRKAAAILRDEWNTPYPFALRRLATDGRTLLESKGRQFQDVVNKQQVFEFAKQFFKNIVVDANGLAEQWYPLGQSRLVVIDPHRSFGAPIIINTGHRTEILYRQFKSEQSIKSVADWFEIGEEAVEEAIDFEVQWSKVAA